MRATGVVDAIGFVGEGDDGVVAFDDDDSRAKRLIKKVARAGSTLMGRRAEKEDR